MKVKKISLKGKGRLSVKELKREALKTGINPALKTGSGTVVEVSKPFFPSRKINLNSPTRKKYSFR